MHRGDHKGQEKFGLNENNISVTWEFTSKDLNVSLFGYFTSKDETMKVNRQSRGNIWFSSPFKITFHYDFVYVQWLSWDYCSS